MADYTEQMLAKWRGGEERDVHQEMMNLALRIVGKTLFGADVTHDAREVGETLDMLLKIASNFGRTVLLPLWVPTPRNLRAKAGVRRIEKIIYRIIAERRKSGHDTGDLLSTLLQVRDEDGTRMNDRQLRDETITLFLAGHETTASTLSWTWWLLAQNPAVEKRFHEELCGVLGGRAPTMDDLPKLTYLGHVLTESLRLYPPAWGMARLAEEEHEIAGYPVAAGIRRGYGAVGGAPRRAVVRCAAGVSSGALGKRPGEAAAAVRVFSVWRRAEAVHRKHFCADGSERGAGHGGTEIPVRAGAGS
jgi:cytochrome P450